MCLGILNSMLQVKPRLVYRHTNDKNNAITYATSYNNSLVAKSKNDAETHGAQDGKLSFFIAKYSSGNNVAQIWKLIAPQSDDPTLVWENDCSYISWMEAMLLFDNERAVLVFVTQNYGSPKTTHEKGKNGNAFKDTEHDLKKSSTIHLLDPVGKTLYTSYTFENESISSIKVLSRDGSLHANDHIVVESMNYETCITTISVLQPVKIGNQTCSELNYSIIIKKTYKITSAIMEKQPILKFQYLTRFSNREHIFWYLYGSKLSFIKILIVDPLDRHKGDNNDDVTIIQLETFDLVASMETPRKEPLLHRLNDLQVYDIKICNYKSNVELFVKFKYSYKIVQLRIDSERIVLENDTDGNYLVHYKGCANSMVNCSTQRRINIPSYFHENRYKNFFTMYLDIKSPMKTIVADRQIFILKDRNLYHYYLPGNIDPSDYDFLILKKMKLNELSK